MKRRVRKIANFFAFNLLFFALYLNFIHKDKSSVNFNGETASHQTAAFSGTAMTETQEAEKKDAPVAQPKADQPSTAALKLTIN